MNAKKACRKAAHRSLDGHVRFVVAADKAIEIFDLRAMATRGSHVDVLVAFSAGKCITPRRH